MTVFKHKKYLGQNFLKNKSVLNKICCINDLKNQIVIEIGPGKGYLTKKILEKKPRKIYLIEKDHSLKPYLLKIIQEDPKRFEIFFDDALKIDLRSFSDQKFFLVSNLPYNVASTLIVKWLKNIKIFKSLVVMVQKEVAERFVAKAGTKLYGRISVLIQAFSHVKKKLDVDPEHFFPKPKIKSSVIEITPKQKISIDYEKLNRTLKIAFIHRRKTLKNNFKKVDFDIEKFLIKNQLSLNTRPQEVSKDNYVKLSIELFR